MWLKTMPTLPPVLLPKFVTAPAGLTANPSLGRPGRVDGTRELIVAHAPYIVAYRIHENEIQILAIIHAARFGRIHCTVTR